MRVVETNWIKLDYRLTFTAPFHCGGGLSSGFVDRTMVRDGNNDVYIPGSAFKGVARRHCEMLSRLYMLMSDDEIQPPLPLINPHNEQVAALQTQRPITMIERIFGSHRYAGRLFFDDARQPDQAMREYGGGGQEPSSGEGYRNTQVSLSTGIRVDRPTRTMIPGAVHTKEFGLRGMAFYGTISGALSCTPIEEMKGRPGYSLLLLLAGLCLLDHIGGDRSTGKGQCICEVTKLFINKMEFADVVWQAWLEDLDVLALYSLLPGPQEEEA